MLYACFIIYLLLRYNIIIYVAVLTVCLEVTFSLLILCI